MTEEKKEGCFLVVVADVIKRTYQPRRILASNINIVTEYIKRIEERMPGEPLVNITAETFSGLAKKIVMKRQAINAAVAQEPRLKPLTLLKPEIVLELFSAEIRKKAEKGEMHFYTTDILDEETCAELLRHIQQLQKNEVSWAKVPQEELRLKEFREIYRCYKDLCGTWGSKNCYTVERLIELAVQNLKLDTANQLLTKEEASSYELFEEGTLSVVEQSLWEMIVKRSDKKQGTVLVPYEMVSLKELLQKPVLFSGYGVGNEVRFVAEEIINRGLAAGDVSVFYSDAVYENFLAAEFGKRGIPHRFLSGRNADFFPMVRLALDILHFAESEFFCESFEKIVSCEELRIKEENKNGSPNKIYRELRRNKVMWGRQAYELFLEECEVLTEGESRFVRRLLDIFNSEQTVDKLYQELYRFINDYCIKGKLQSRERALLKSVMASLDLMEGKTGLEAIRYLIQRLERLTYKDEMSAGAVTMQKIGTALEYMERDNVFVLGLSAKEFVANTAESPVLSDDELALCLQGNKQVGTIVFARDKDNMKKQWFMNSLRTMKKNARLYCGYNCYDTVESREQNPATFLRSLAELTDTMLPEKPKGYVKLQMDPTERLKEGTCYDFTKDAVLLEKKDESYSFSASSMQTLLKCPAKYLYEKKLGLQAYEPIEKKASVWLEPLERGELYHRILEKYLFAVTENYEKSLAEEVDLELLTKVLEDCMEYARQKKPALSEAVYQKTKEEFRDNVIRYLQKTHREFTEEGWMVAGCEQKFMVSQEIILEQAEQQNLLLQFNGSIDRIDVRVRDDGKRECRIIDYKSGKYTSVENEIKEKQFVQDYVYLTGICSEGVLPGKVEDYDLTTAYMRFEFLEEKSIATYMERRLTDTKDCQNSMCETLARLVCRKMDEKEQFFAADEKQCYYCPYKELCMADRKVVK